MSESIQDKLARRSQPSEVQLKDGRTVRVVSSSCKGGKITRLGVDPGAPGASIEWVDADQIVNGR
jgi:hypothetical protein